MEKQRIVLFGHFGSGNIGNDSTLEAAIQNIPKYLPDAEIICVCNGPKVIAERFHIPTLPFDISESKNEIKSANRSVARVKRLSKRVVDEIQFWLDRPAWFRGAEQFIVVGTGAVDDMGVQRAWNAPYDLYKWCKCAKLGGAKVIFLSVGAGPIVDPLSRILMLRALRLADYRSYRETFALDYLRSVGFDTTGDQLYPDLVFSLQGYFCGSIPKPATPANTVGLGLLNYYGWRHDPSIGEHIYQEYIGKIKQFVAWLLDHGKTVRLIVGDDTDRRPFDEIVEYVRGSKNDAWQGRLIAQECSTVGELFDQLAQTDILVASRFHNVLSALRLERPVISIGYHEKNVALMREMGLDKYCQHIEQFTVESLIQQFQEYEDAGDQTISKIHAQLENYRRLLDEQYQKIFLDERNFK